MIIGARKCIALSMIRVRVTDECQVRGKDKKERKDSCTRESKINTYAIVVLDLQAKVHVLLDVVRRLAIVAVRWIEIVAMR